MPMLMRLHGRIELSGWVARPADELQKEQKHAERPDCSFTAIDFGFDSDSMDDNDMDVAYRCA